MRRYSAILIIDIAMCINRSQVINVMVIDNIEFGQNQAFDSDYCIDKPPEHKFAAIYL
jgi:hypothetical protein